MKDKPLRFIHGHHRGGRPPLKFEEVVDIQGEDGCWVWLASTHLGYGNLWDRPRNRQGLAHRLFYEAFVGPIPEDLELDHLCRNRACVNPNHLEPVTRHENLLRGAGTKIHPSRHSELLAHFESSGLSRSAFGRQFASEYGGVTPKTLAELITKLVGPHIRQCEERDKRARFRYATRHGKDVA